MDDSNIIFGNAWLIFIFTGAFYVVLYFKFYKQIKRIEAEAEGIFECVGFTRLYFIVIWLTFQNILFVYSIFIKPSDLMFILVLVIGIIPFSYLGRGIICYNDKELFVDATILKISSIKSIEFDSRIGRNGRIYIAYFYNYDGREKHQSISNDAISFLKYNFPDKCS